MRKTLFDNFWKLYSDRNLRSKKIKVYPKFFLKKSKFLRKICKHFDLVIWKGVFSEKLLFFRQRRKIAHPSPVLIILTNNFFTITTTKQLNRIRGFFWFSYFPVDKRNLKAFGGVPTWPPMCVTPTFQYSILFYYWILIFATTLKGDIYMSISST